MSVPYSQILDVRVESTLDALRRRIRRYVWGYGLGVTLATACGIFWLSLGCDWFFEPAVGVRIVLLLAAMGGIAVVVMNFLANRLRFPLTDAHVAMVLERRFPELDDTLLTAVLLAPRLDQMDGLSREMFARTCREASRRIGGTRVDDAFNPVPLRVGVAAAAVLAASIALFGLLTPQSLGTWARRSLLLSDESWPRRTSLGIEGFENGARRVGRGANLKIVATADRKMPIVPRTVDVRYRTDGGARGNEPMDREGEAASDRDRFQHYTYTFKGILSPITFDLVGGDARVDGLRIEVVESPKVESLELRCEYPAYMDRTARRLPVIGPMQIPRRTSVMVEGRANKRLARVSVVASSEGYSGEPMPIEPAADVVDGRTFRYALGPLKQDVTLSFTTRDTDGIESPESTRLTLVAVDDEPPELNVTLSGIGSAITPAARLPVVGKARDDYGIAETWFEYSTGHGKTGRKTIAAPRDNVTELKLDDAMEVRDLDVAPGAKLLFGLKASDRCDARAKPRLGETQRWQLDVVTPERLRAMLQAREQTLRYRFEQIVQEVNETRNALTRISFGDDAAKPSSAKSETKSTAKASDPSADGAEPGERKAGDRTGREPGDQAIPSATASPEEERQRRVAATRLRCERAVQNSRKNANETLGTAEAFDDLRLQLINNRIDTEELKIRMKSGVADPLRVIGERMFPELDRRLLALGDSLADERTGPARRDAAKEQVDAILTAMNRVLSRMMELEDFNQAITLLQEIIERQRKLEKETQQRHKTRLRELLEEK
ncbi:MAG TPA: hypothetical protein VJL29_13740 [Thermoguttaceae bacterium]|nr:hypothetical protein [Thermoguttaceae bacterium]